MPNSTFFLPVSIYLQNNSWNALYKPYLIVELLVGIILKRNDTVQFVRDLSLSLLVLNLGINPQGRIDILVSYPLLNAFNIHTLMYQYGYARTSQTMKCDVLRKLRYLIGCGIRLLLRKSVRRRFGRSVSHSHKRIHTVTPFAIFFFFFGLC